ncbi:hypothetical protein K0M31_009225 [Melipona bicolor]|uniref:Uncharacterized protein n=1 Tax=Melipona bicolor TaxID=60889 RepID=A0AA40KJK1_9HYME|nr:hypothetical protein K0M31_009225 [Melipona bicolor]
MTAVTQVGREEEKEEGWKRKNIVGGTEHSQTFDAHRTHLDDDCLLVIIVISFVYDTTIARGDGLVGRIGENFARCTSNHTATIDTATTRTAVAYLPPAESPDIPPCRYWPFQPASDGFSAGPTARHPLSRRGKRSVIYFYVQLFILPIRENKNKTDEYLYTEERPKLSEKRRTRTGAGTGPKPNKVKP